MAIGPRRPRFYAGVLTVGFVLGGFLSALLRRFLPPGPAKEFFTFTRSPAIGPLHLDLVILNVTLGPVSLDVSLLAVVGVVLAFLVARSLF
jgi:Domain of unknown function (DUF4321)